MDNNELEVLGQTGVIDTVQEPNPVNKEQNDKEDKVVVPIPVADNTTSNNDEVQETPKEEKKDKKMDLKTLFLLGLGVIGILVAIIFVIINFTGKKLTVKFDSNGGSKVASITVRKGKSITRPKTPTKEDYIFVEWQLDGKKYDFNKSVNKNITLKAVWEVRLTDDIYTITFNSKGGTQIESQNVNGNGQVLKPEDPTKPHNKFMGWQLDGKLYDFDSLVKKDITLEATWELLPTHNVKIDSDGAYPDYTQVIFEGDLVEVPKDPKKPGKKFIEWQKSSRKYNFETPVVEDFTLVAKYEDAKQYTVSFDLNGGVCPKCTPQKVEDGTVIIKPNDPTKDGYTFAGWYKDKELTKAYDLKELVTGDMTLYAKWTQSETKMCTVTLTDFNTGESFKLPVKCGTKINDDLVKKTIDKDCISTYGADRKDVCCSSIPLRYYDIASDTDKGSFDYNTIIDKDVSLSFMLARGIASDNEKC